MIVYAESSAVLSWLLGELRGETARRALETAEFVVTSDLTLVECDRALHRARALGEISPERFSSLRATIGRVTSDWGLMRLNDEIIARARDGFPEEPIRALDALHLATVLHAKAQIPELALLSYDQRVRRCALALGLSLVPATD